MDNFDIILKKHFQKISSPEEEEIVSQFKEKNQHEYSIYKHLWNSKTVVFVRDYDVDAAWLKVLTAKRQKTINLYTHFRQIAAVAVLLIVGFISFYLINQQVVHKEILATATSSEIRKEVLLSDGSTIWLNRNAELKYPKKFGKKTRDVQLNGQAYFEIAKNPEKPFVIRTNHSDVTVLGTTFNINTTTEITEVSVTTGKVNVKSLFTGESIDLLPDFTASVTQNSIKKTGTGNPNYMSWKTGKFSFKETPLRVVIDDLKSFYEKKIVVKTQGSQCILTATFDNAELEDILEVLAVTCKLKIVKNQDNYEIY